ncbi:MAG: DNRLRE domain-containing protein [Peptococcaceae bacterium]
MNSLEKKMFFLPNRLFIKKDKLFLAFNLSVIPRDMDVTSMFLYIPLPGYATSTNVYVKEITSRWSEKSLKKGSTPTRSGLLQLISCPPKQDTLNINVTNLHPKWRLKRKNNHGIYIRFKNQNIKHLESNPPYLVIDTI